MNRSFPLLGLILLIFLSSCDSMISAGGKVLDAETKQPLDSVSVSLAKLQTTFTDSAGNFHISRIMYGSPYSEPHLLFERTGYKPAYIYKKSEKDITVYLQKGVKFEPLISEKWIKNFFYLNKYFLTSIVIFTFFFVLFKTRLRRKALWLIGILTINLKFLISYLDAHIVDFKPFAPPLFFKHYWTHPFAVEIIIPIVTILFWYFYFFKRHLLTKTER